MLGGFKNYQTLKPWAVFVLLIIVGLTMRLHGNDRPLVGFFDGGRAGLHVNNLDNLSIPEHRFRAIDNSFHKSVQTYPNHPPFVIVTSFAFSKIFSSDE